MATRSSKQINLLRGWPYPALLPPQSMNDAAKTVFSDNRVAYPALLYGDDEGYKPLREEIARWLTQFYEHEIPISPARICISGGASQNLACVLQTFTDPVYTRNVWMVAPTYFLACRIFEDSGFAGRMRAVPEDEEGIDIDYLSKKIRQSEDDAIAGGNVEPKMKPVRSWRKIFKHVIYAVPTFSNPSGRIMSLRRRTALVKLARQYDALIVTDDVYDMLQWSAEEEVTTGKFHRAYLPRIVDIDRSLEGAASDGYGNAVSNGTFSKMIGPGCRTGWAEGTEKFAYGLSQTGSSRSGGSPSQLVATFIYQMLANGDFTRHIHEELQPTYARRFHRMMRAIKSQLVPLGVTIPQLNKEVAGGYFIWLTLPEPVLAEALTKRALEEEDLIVIEGPRLRVIGDEENKETRFERDIRLCFAWEEEDALEEGVSRLAKVLQKELERGGGSYVDGGHFESVGT